MNKKNDDWKDKGWFIHAGILLSFSLVWWLVFLPMGCCFQTDRILNVRVVDDVLTVSGVISDPRFESSKILLPRSIIGPTLLAEPFNDALIVILTTGHSYFISPNGKKYPKAFEVSPEHYKEIINWLRGNGVIVIQKKFTKKDIEQTQQKFPYRKER